MGRIFETRKATMFARWNKMAKTFTRMARDIALAVKAGGPHPESNAALRRVIANARAVNMPKDKIEAAIKRASGQDQASFDIVMYEGYGPHGVPLLIETATDNPTRTVGNLRSYFKAFGGNLGTTGSVSFMFQQMGVFKLVPEGLDLEVLELELIDHGLEEIGEATGEKGEPIVIARCSFASFGQMQAALEAKGITPISAEHEYIAKTFTELPEAQAVEFLALVDKIEQDEDVQRVFHNLA